MGYTIENGKPVIWTDKYFEADAYPFNDEGTNYTRFYKNLYDKKPFLQCLARLTNEEKATIVKNETGLTTFILKSKKQHHNQKRKSQNK